MALPVTFATLPAGNNPASLIDTQFAAVAAMGTIYCTALGSNAVTLTPAPNQPTVTAYTAGMTVAWIQPTTNTGAVTLAVSGLGAVALTTYKTSTGVNAAMTGGELPGGQLVLATFDGTQFQATASSAASVQPQFSWGRNALFNPNFYLAQRIGMTHGNNIALAASVATPTFDRWYCVSGNGTGTTNYNVTNAPVNNQSILILVRTAGQTGVNPFILAQALDSDQIIPLQGKIVTASVRLQTGGGFSGTGGGTVSMVLYTGTGAPAKRGAGFTGEVVVMNPGIVLGQSSQWTTFSFTSIAPIPMNATQGELRLTWTPSGTAAAGDQVNFANAQLEIGTQFTGFEYRPAAVEWQICQRFYFKTFQQGTQPAQNAGLGGAFQFPQPVAASANTGCPAIPYIVRMRALPAITFYNPQAANAQCRNVSVGADCSGTVTSSGSEQWLNWATTTAPASVAGQLLALHFTADSEI